MISIRQKEGHAYLSIQVQVQVQPMFTSAMVFWISCHVMNLFPDMHPAARNRADGGLSAEGVAGGPRDSDFITLYLSVSSIWRGL